PAPPETTTFQGVYSDSPAPRACGPRHSFQVPAGKQRIAASAAAQIPSNDIILKLYGPSGGEPLGTSDTATSPEAVTYAPDGGVPSGTYQVEVCPFDDPAAPPQAPYNYAGTFTTDDTAPPSAGGSPTPTPSPTATPTPGPGSVPRYHNYSPPQAVGETAAEPSIGFNPVTRRAMYISGLQTLRVTFPENIAPAGSTPEAGPARWEDVSYISTKTRSLDPILFTDQRTGRTFVSQLNSVAVAGAVLLPGNSLMAFTDDDGASWTPAQLNLPDGSNDHQTVGAGPYPASVPLGNSVNKGSAVYYCGQSGNVFVATSVALCSRSDNGGLTFNRAVPVYTGVVGVSGPSCSQLIHGHVKVAPDGTVYLPNAQCGGRQAVAVSTDAGTTWTVRTIPGSLPPSGILDPSVGISNDPPGPGATSNTIYVGYTGRPTPSSTDNHAYAVMSKDRGLTWSTPVDLGASHGIKNAVFAQTVAGDSNRAAVAFLGTTTGGNHQAADFKGTWYGYVAHTYDGGATWTTVQVTPNPVQREACIWNGGGNNPCRNLLDFNDATMDDRGRVLFAYADGCINECEKGGANTYSAKASIARQSGGKGLLAQYDAVEPALPQRPYLSGRRDDMASYLNWSPPDHGGSDITAYKIYRGTAPGHEVLIGRAAGDATTFNDRGGDPAVGNYTYKITAVNALGEGAASNPVTLAVGPRVEATGACELPGVTAILDPAGDASNGQPFHDITSVSMAEPDDLPGKVAFTMKVASLSTIPPGWRWAVRFSAPQRPPNAVYGATEDWFVSLVTSDGLAPAFTYGTTGVPQNAARVFTTVGNLDPASKVDADGTITLVLPKSVIGSPTPGQAITGMLGSVRATVPSALPGTGGTNETIPDSTGGGAYTLRAANLCLPNTAPLARLTADVEEGVKPLTVHFDASASSDADAIDTISSYTFNFGDGSDDVVSPSPAVSHTFTQAGEYPVRLVVTDSRGKVSANTAQFLVEVERDAACSLNVALAANGATATASSTYPDRNYSPDGVINGDRAGLNWDAGGGWNDATYGVWPDTFEINFAGSRKVDQIRVYTVQNDFRNPVEPTPTTPATDYGIADFDVQYWDGDSWETVTGGNVTGNDKAMRVFAFAPVTTSKIRVVVNKSRESWSRITEVEAFGCDSQ
ncbi:MAG: PKD domain-containing protein, partial [Acidobacteriota bacterium]|nr:PKD domain-containing protein [Acidobacteriota bacterium]